MIEINGDALKDSSTPLPAASGQGNKLTVRSADTVSSDGLIAILEVISPDGRSRTERAPMGSEEAVLDIGPFTAPAIYDYESGVVYRRGYRLKLRLENNETKEFLGRWTFYQGLTQDAEKEWFFPGDVERIVYNDGYIPKGEIWNPFKYSGAPMDPPILLRLHPSVLCDPDQVKPMFRLRERPAVAGPIWTMLVVRDSRGKDVYPKTSVQVSNNWQTLSLPVKEWPDGNYSLELWPRVEGRIYQEGPSIMYRRKKPKPTEVSVSPLSPFTLEHDPTRSTLTFNGSALQPHLNPEVSGWYAVFASARGPCGLKVGPESWIRRLDTSITPEFGDVFVTAADLTGGEIGIIDNETEECGLQSLCLTPVTETSVTAFRKLVENPPVELRGVADWWDYFPHMKIRVPSTIDESEFDIILRGQREVGISSIAWALGRSWVNYHSKLPDTCLFPCVPLTPEHIEKYPWHEVWRHVVRDLDPWIHTLAHSKDHQMTLYGWLCMNRHYGSDPPYAVFHSPWIKAHPEFNQWLKDGKHRDTSRVEYFFEEARRERLNILEEAAGYGPSGMVVGCCRQPPMAGYNPEMVKAYCKETGEDPGDLDITDGDRFWKWLRWRAQGFTVLMRELRRRITGVENRVGHRIPIAVRVPDEGLEWNLAEGMDVETWIRERLIDELMLDPLEDCMRQGSHKVTPYITLCRKHGIRVFGGVNPTTVCPLPQFGNRYNPVVGLRRALGLLHAGVDGLEIYESEIFAGCTHERWLIPMWGNVKFCEKFLTESNIEAVFPIMAGDALLGHDNHWLYAFSLKGRRGDPIPRGATSLL